MTKQFLMGLLRRFAGIRVQVHVALAACCGKVYSSASISMLVGACRCHNKDVAVPVAALRTRG